jgi:dTDP-4-dehydrorhamnose 3,5-epimerase
MPIPLDHIHGAELAQAKRSLVTRSGSPNLDLIEGVYFHPTRPVTHDDGYVTEVLRTSWDFLQAPVAQVHITATLPKRVRAWGLHQHTVDRLFVVTGYARLVCYDGRESSPTYGRINEFYAGERSPGLLVIPPGIYHGWKNLGDTETVFISMPSTLYDYEQPDVVLLEASDPVTPTIIDYQW